MSEKDDRDLDAWHGLPSNPKNRHALFVGAPAIGEGTWIGPFTVIDGSGGLTIGKGCDISAGAQIYTHSTVARCVSERRHAEVDRRSTEIGDFVHIGANATILMGAKIGHHSVIAAGAVVREGAEVPPYSVVVGVPGRVLPDAARKWAVDG
ncbi:MAG: acyltransferase [Labilithrix sp.]|nr:acyltransferase [Labilithrix sp.]MCW5810802.1 acyltransferase [Labilithrix sp.]